MTEKYQAVIGLEVHVELATKSKIFCSCSTGFGAPPNTNICPICMGLPGTLPTLNKRAVEYAIAAGLATGCSIARVTRFDRKNYFYPDLPKAYQISQLELPLCSGGEIEISCGGNKKKIAITRIHLEEDAGKLIHDKERGTMIDYNRCGVPLVEIVSEPSISSSTEARAYLNELRTVLLYTGISDCRMDKGAMRCDVNISVKRRGDATMGVRTEIKNVNSVAFVAKAIDYEIERQIAIIDSGGEIFPETRRFSESDGKTYLMRKKESAADYRFFPEPDLPSFEISEEMIDGVRDKLPVCPAQRRKTYALEYGLSATDAEIITSRIEIADFFEQVAAMTAYPKVAANILLTELMSELTERINSGCECVLTVSAAALAEIAELYATEVINSSTVKRLISLVKGGDASASELVKKLDLGQINDREFLAKILSEVDAETPKLIEDYKNGKLAAKKAVVGKVMAKTSGRANPVIVNELFEEYITAP